MSGQAVIPWRILVVMVPELVQWYVQTYGPTPDDDLGVTEGRFDAIVTEWERAS